MQDGAFESPGISAKGTSISASAVAHCAMTKMDGGFGKSRMHREREIRMVEFLAADETRKA